MAGRVNSKFQQWFPANFGSAMGCGDERRKPDQVKMAHKPPIKGGSGARRLTAKAASDG